MKQFFTAMILVIATTGHCQTLNDELIKLARIYRNFHFSNDPSKEVIDQLESISSKELQASKAFIAELIKKNNRIGTTQFFTRPDSITIKNLFTIRSINWNMHEADPIDNYALIDSLNKFAASPYEQLSCYYGMLFTSIGNKNNPLNMSGINITLDSYGLKDDTEKGILFLEGMKTFGMMIWGYMNVVKPPNYEKTLSVISNYPRYNGQPYYQFQDLNFKDFNLTIDKRRGKESFKKYYINKYLNTLLYHSAALGQKKKTKAEQQNVMLGSIMRNESYYKYSDNPEAFQQIFKKVKDQ
jgi:hypothetical protein